MASTFTIKQEGIKKPLFIVVGYNGFISKIEV